MMDLDLQSRIFIYESLLKQVFLFQTGAAVAKIGSSLKPNPHNQVLPS